MKGQHVVFSAGKNDWQTPKPLFDLLNNEFRFTMDGAADASNHLCPLWFGPGSVLGEDALQESWEGERLWVNPPYTLVKDFIHKGYAERHHALSVCLIPSRTDTRYWHNCVWNGATHYWRAGVRGRFLKGRVRFVDPSGALIRKGSSNSAPFPSVLVIFGDMSRVT